jgi:hypothetical protein
VTRRQVDAANPQTVLSQIDAWKKSAKEMVSHAGIYRQLITNPGGQPWSGQTRDAAIDMAGNDCKAVEHMREAIDAMGDAAADAINFSVIPNLKAVRVEIAAAEHDGFSVADDLSVTDTKRQDDDAPDPKRTQNRDNYEREIRAAAQKWRDSDQAVADQIINDKQGLAAEFNPLATGALPSDSELADLTRVTDQAVVDQVAKAHTAQKAIDDAAQTVYTKGVGSPEGQAALARLPHLKKNLLDALSTLGKLPDYSKVDPHSLHTNADGHFGFGPNVNGKPQVYGQLKNGTGDFFDESTQTRYVFKDGKLVNAFTQDPGKVTATTEPLLTAVTAAAGAPELKAAAEGAVQGIKALLTREALETGSALGTGVTSENVFSRGLAAADARAETASQHLAAGQTDHPPIPDPGVGVSEHPPPVTVGGHSDAGTLFDLTSDHALSLGTDPARGGAFVGNEAETGLRIEHELGVNLSRAEEGKPYDFIDSAGKTYDAVGNFPSKFFESQWENLQQQIIRHAEFKADIVPVDVSKFTIEQQNTVREFVQSLRNANVIIIGGQ